VEEGKIAHLGFIQAIITRMATHSFIVKGWSITVAAGLFAVAAGNSNATIAILAFFPAIMFWVLDTFFLLQERLFRELYRAVSQGDSSIAEFSMDTSPFKKVVSSGPQIAFSKTMLLFHGTIVASIFIIVLVLALS